MKALLIHNPRAGHADRSGEIAAVASQLGSAGWQVEVATSTGVAAVESLSREAVERGIEVVVVAGGDGSLNAAVQALAHQRTALGVLPVGTANIWAREMRIPVDVRAAARVLLSGETAQVDLGQADGRYFLCLASVGFDASVTRQVDLKTKRRLGRAAYVIAGAVEVLKLRGEEVTILADGNQSRQRVLMVVVSNTRLYGGGLAMAPGAFADDGLMDVVVFRGRGLLDAVRHMANVLLGRHRRDPEAESILCSWISVDARGSLPVQLDGDYFGTTPVTFRVIPRALRVLIPPGPHPQLKRRGWGIGDRDRGN